MLESLYDVVEIMAPCPRNGKDRRRNQKKEDNHTTEKRTTESTERVTCKSREYNTPGKNKDSNGAREGEYA